MTSDALPIPGFVVKLKAPDGTQHYVNVGSHPVIERPLRPDDSAVDDQHLRTRGLDNLRVPLLTGLARTVVLAGDDEAVCIDVIFNPAVLAVALPDGMPEVADEEDDSKPKVKKGVGKNGDIDPDLAKFVRIRVIELALKNAEDDLGYKIGRNFTLPRGVSYRGGVGGSRQPVPMPGLRQLAAAVAHEKAQKASQAAPGPWRSKRDAAGLANSAKIEDITDSSGRSSAKEKPLIKKGFLNSSKGQIYPEGSSEGMLYGDIKTAGDPLGYIPKGLRSRVNVVDTKTTDASKQNDIMEAYASGRKVPKENASIASGGGGGTGHYAGSAKSGGGGGGGVAKGFLNGNGGSLYPDGSKEGTGPKPNMSEMEMLREMVPDQAAVEKLAAETDTESFMSDLAQMGSMMGLGGAGPDMGEMSQMAREAMSDMRAYSGSRLPSEGEAPMPSGPEIKGGASSLGTEIARAKATAARLAGEVEPEARVQMLQKELGTGGEATPEYSVDEAADSLTLKVSLPEMMSLGETSVDVSNERFTMHAPGLYKLDLEWPRAGVADEAKAKFSKKSRTLQVTIPLVV